MTHPAPPDSVTKLHQWFTLRNELFWIYRGDVVSAATDLVADHSQGYWMWLLESGSAEVVAQNRRLGARAGQWLLSPNGVIHQKFSPDARIISLHFSSQWPTGENLFVETEGGVFAEAKFPRLKRAAVSLHRLAARHFPGVQADMFDHEAGYRVFLRFQLAFQQWLADFADAMLDSGHTLAISSRLDDRINTVISLLHNTPPSAGFPETLITGRVNLGRRQLDRLFIDGLGISTREYWDRLREQAAIRLIKESRQPAKQIAYTLGFRQASHFTKWFTQRTGRTPSAFRELPASHLAWGQTNTTDAPASAR